MDKKQNVSGADFYALREFLVRHYAVTDSDFSLPNQTRIKEMFGGSHYLFTHVNKDNEDLEFKLRRTGMFKYYDIIDFGYSNGSIQIQKGDIKYKSDKEKVKELGDVLESRCYSNIISNFDELSKL